MTYLNIHDPEVRAKLIANGWIWRGGPKTWLLACEDIAAGRVPEPGNIPEAAKTWVQALREGKTITIPQAPVRRPVAKPVAKPIKPEPRKGYARPGDPTDPVPVVADPSDAGWRCPDHGMTDLITLTSRAMRVYRVCGVGDCDEYEPPLA